MKYYKRLQDLRNDNDLTQEDIAKILNTTKQTYGRYEKGKRKLSIEDLIKIADFYGVSTDYILGRTDNPEINTEKPTDIIKSITKIKNQINGNINGDVTMK
ncbi:MAG: helix-turn-helix transcriptional regulator [Clostridia bacterium]|nr:helix-turn-helix transcriptional regulator [Clostridia bacterium]